MIKDLIVNLSIDGTDSETVDYAISCARTFDAHLAAVAFAYEAVPAAMLGNDALPELFEQMQKEAEDSAKAAVAKFEEATRGSGLSFEIALDLHQLRRHRRSVRSHRAPV